MSALRYATPAVPPCVAASRALRARKWQIIRDSAVCPVGASPHAALMKTEDEVVVRFPDTVIKTEDDVDTAMSYLHGTDLITAPQQKSEDAANTRFSFNHEGPEVFARHADRHASIPDPPDGTPRVKIVDRIIGQLNGRRPEGADMTVIEAVFGEQPALTLGKKGRRKWRRRVHFLFLSDFAHFHGRAQDGRTAKVENDVKSPGTHEVPHTVMDSVNILRISDTTPGERRQVPNRKQRRQDAKDDTKRVLRTKSQDSKDMGKLHGVSVIPTTSADTLVQVVQPRLHVPLKHYTSNTPKSAMVSSNGADFVAGNDSQNTSVFSTTAPNDWWDQPSIERQSHEYASEHDDLVPVHDVMRAVKREILDDCLQDIKETIIRPVLSELLHTTKRRRLGDQETTSSEDLL